jgi:hypothetical protein
MKLKSLCNQKAIFYNISNYDEILHAFLLCAEVGISNLKSKKWWSYRYVCMNHFCLKGQSPGKLVPASLGTLSARTINFCGNTSM